MSNEPGFIYRATEVTLRAPNDKKLDILGDLRVNDINISKEILDQLRARGVTKIVLEI